MYNIHDIKSRCNIYGKKIVHMVCKILKIKLQTNTWMPHVTWSPWKKTFTLTPLDVNSFDCVYTNNNFFKLSKILSIETKKHKHKNKFQGELMWITSTLSIRSRLFQT
jgi:hypothetical protein